MTRRSWLGLVVVVTGDAAALPAVADSFVDDGAFVAFVSSTAATTGAQVAFRADPGDAVVWERVAPQVEQRLGPVDLVVVEHRVAAVVRAVFEPDLHRRGRDAAVVTVDAADDAETIVRTARGRR